MPKKFWDWLAPVSVGLVLIGLMIYLQDSSYADDFDITLATEVQWVGGLTNQEGEYSYWVVEYAGEDGKGNIHRWREEVKLVRGSTQLDAAVQAGRQFQEKVEAGNVQALGFLKAVANGQANEL